MLNSKILVDILVDENKYYVYQGRELSSIFENAFDTFTINQDSMLRYAGRRTAQDKLKWFILNKTNLKLRVYSENSLWLHLEPAPGNGLENLEGKYDAGLAERMIMAFILVEDLQQSELPFTF